MRLIDKVFDKEQIVEQIVDRVQGARDSTSVSHALVSARQGRRLVKKSRIIDLRNKKVCHIRARDESGGPVARIGLDAICPRAAHASHCAALN